ncbi:hypothetical protein [Endozoicomonas sp. SCSIO W0465]|uniref:hypothetical protein n=1 Tax=Endozoicomonas sp. SCSIO W0465 TaxID=2918516 RepID=UPI002075BC52|nr:hypothetical protein [Endozoicomonas sp. SCSIO W0465]USE38472.1 hypothetical protein MJO57_10065 [Endozoicomonas sp. SCSIO W0465]
MDYPQPLSQPQSQPLSAQTASTYPEANTATSAPLKKAESLSQPEPAGSNFSVGDAAWVLMRTLSTAAECLNFAWRKVVIISSVCFGGFIGLLHYAHENPGNRTVQKLPAEENSRVYLQPPPALQNPPIEEYVMASASRWKRWVESSTTPESNYSWMQLIGMAVSITSSVWVLGVMGSLILHIPGLLLKAEPYITLDEPTHHSYSESLTRPVSILPSNRQEPKAPAIDPVVDGQPHGHAINQSPPLIEPKPTGLISGESDQGLLDIPSIPSASSSQKTEKAAVYTLPLNITSPTGHKVPTSVTVDVHGV